MAQSEVGRIRIFEDFIGGIDVAVAETTAPPIDYPPYFALVGQGLADTDSGAVHLDSDGVNGVLQLTATNELEHAIGLQTATMFDVGLQGTIVMEVRVRQAALVTRQVFVGFSDVVTDLAILEGAIIKGTGTTLTLTASDLVGFLFASELTDTADWHMVYNGGTTAGETTSTKVDADVTAVAGEYNILRLEIDNNGTARWYIDGVLKQTVAAAVSTTTDMAAQVIAEEKVTGNASVDLDYILIEANRDWTV